MLLYLFISDLYFYSLTLALSAYTSLLLFFTSGWLRLPQKAPDKKQLGNTFVSIIVPARNEERNIIRCLKSIIHQLFPKDRYEILVINDNSIDTTREKVIECTRKFPEVNLVLIDLETESLAPKKQAIESGIEQAKGNLIITTDADCTFNKNWLKSMVYFYLDQKPKMIIGPVAIPATDLFSAIQSIEFAALIGAGGGAAGWNNPYTCNGANLLYEKEAFLDVNGFKNISNISSGDDILLLHKFKKTYPGKIKFIKQKDAIVQTKAENTLIFFFHQRLRWASKNKTYTDPFTLITGIIVLMVNCLLFISFVSSIILNELVELFMVPFIIKCLIDFLFLFLIFRFFNNNKLLVYIFPLQFIYFFYIMLIFAYSSLNNSYQWKGRKAR